MNCNYCGKKQYLTGRSRMKMVVCTMLPPFTLLLPLLFNISFITGLFLLIGSFLLAICIIPFFTELSNKEEFMP
ncbi:TIGR04104 family putative zinc finger protein [Texcoconibacillus texcoconensis]|uniref:TIGR04104 family putative zinc finger protein n=1 Tax=Texcoconibacillus texcoconensis TaxID=1095777 RepID=UPI003CCD10D5